MGAFLGQGRIGNKKAFRKPNLLEPPNGAGNGAGLTLMMEGIPSVTRVGVAAFGFLCLGGEGETAL